MYAEATKVCNGPLCDGKEWPLSEFYKASARVDGRQHYCKACHKSLNSKYRQTTQGKAACVKSSRAWKDRNFASYLLHGCQLRARRKGIECSLAIEWIKAKLQAGVCEVTGIAFEFERNGNPFLPSIDRIDSDKGYTPDNCRVVLWIINTAKHTLSEEKFRPALLQVAEAVVERL